MLTTTALLTLLPLLARAQSSESATFTETAISETATYTETAITESQTYTFTPISESATVSDIPIPTYGPAPPEVEAAFNTCAPGASKYYLLGSTFYFPPRPGVDAGAGSNYSTDSEAWRNADPATAPCDVAISLDSICTAAGAAQTKQCVCGGLNGLSSGEYSDDPDYPARGEYKAAWEACYACLGENGAERWDVLYKVIDETLKSLEEMCGGAPEEGEDSGEDDDAVATATSPPSPTEEGVLPTGEGVVPEGAAGRVEVGGLVMALMGAAVLL